MKNILYSLFVVLSITIFNSAYGQEAMVINGHSEIPTLEKVVLYKVVNGRLEPIAETGLVNQQFAFKFFPQYEGFYALGNPSSTTHGTYHTFYGKEKDVITVNFHKTHLEVIGKASTENKDMHRFQSLLKDYKFASTLNSRTLFEEFFDSLAMILPKAQAFKAKSKNPQFLALFENFRDYAFTYYALNYRFMPKSKQPSAQQLAPFYSQVAHKNYLQAPLLDLPFGDAFMNLLLTDAYIAQKNKANPAKNHRQNNLDFIDNEIIKGQYLTASAVSLKSYDEYLALVEPNKQYIQLEDQQKRLEEILTKLADSKPGTNFIDFSFLDRQGNTITKSSLAGKIVVLDFWATWCGPCRQEEPFFEKLAQDYKGQDVVFVGISSDKDKQAWEKHVQAQEGHFAGIHLHAGPSNILSQAYKITGIPRYMVLDKKGAIISTNAPRPSSKDLKTLIDKHLLP